VVWQAASTTQEVAMRCIVSLALLVATSAGCGAARPALHAELGPAEWAGAPLEQNHFQGDRSAEISEEALARVLTAPVGLEAQARVGVLRVQDRFAVDPDLPLGDITASLALALERTGAFDVASEMATDWPASSGVAGLRELAARYRCEYLLLYRHRFVDRTLANAWAVAWLTVIGAFVVPSSTIETEGIVEATLFDVKTGTILFTVYERVSASSEENVWQNERKLSRLQARLLEGAATPLGEEVASQVQRLLARGPLPAGPAPVQAASAPR
jgi:hypothetical protein